jgi:hypothetical protein
MKSVWVTVTSKATFSTIVEVDEDLLSKPDKLASEIQRRAGEPGRYEKIQVGVPGHRPPGVHDEPRAQVVRIARADGSAVWADVKG